MPRPLSAPRLLARTLRPNDRLLLMPSPRRGAMLQILRRGGLQWAEMPIPVRDLLPGADPRHPNTPNTLLWVLRGAPPVYLAASLDGEKAPVPDSAVLALASAKTRREYDSLLEEQFVPYDVPSDPTGHPLYPVFKWARALEFPVPSVLVSDLRSMPTLRVHEGALFQTDTDTHQQVVLNHLRQHLPREDWEVFPVPGGVQLWRLAGSAVALPREGRTDYRGLAAKMGACDSILFPPPVADKASASLSQAIRTQRPTYRPVLRSYPDGSKRVWLWPLDPEQEPNRTARSSHGLKVDGLPITIESGVPVPASVWGSSTTCDVEFGPGGVLYVDDRNHANRVSRQLKRSGVRHRVAQGADDVWFVKRLPTPPLTHLEPPSR